MSSKELTKNIKKPAEDTNLSWERQKQLEEKYLRESSRIKQRRGLQTK